MSFFPTVLLSYCHTVILSYCPRAIWLNVLGIGTLLLLCAYGGLVMFAYYHDCDPITARQVKKNDQLFPLFVMQVCTGTL